MELTPEERRKIYEEEKARIEAREQIEREKKGQPQESSTSLAPNIAGFLCYLGFWISGIVFLVLEQRNKWVRFHAAQSIITFGTLFIASMAFGWIPVIGPVFSTIIGITGFVLWIVLMTKAFNGETFKVPLAGDIAEKIVNADIIPPYQRPPEAPPAAPGQAGAAPPSPAAPAEKVETRPARGWEHGRGGRITGSAFTIAWCIVVFIVFTFLRDYIAFYEADTSGGGVNLTAFPFFTSDIDLWLPILWATLAISVIGHLIMIIYDNYVLRQSIHVITDAFGMATIVTLLSVFPFDFNVIPDSAAATGTHIGVIVVLVLLSVGFGIGILVRIIKLIVNLLKGTANFRQAV
jgi:uncharacterized membrane protein